MRALSIGAIESDRMPVPGPLIAAYEAAHYVVFGEPDIVMKVGEKNAQIDALLAAQGADRAAFVSAANPRGLRRRLAENVVAFHTLRNVLRKSRYLVYEGEGRDPKGAWRPEGSVLVLGIAREDAEALGRRFGQNAILYLEKGRAPELVLLR
jgi:hypothetical protein